MRRYLILGIKVRELSQKKLHRILDIAADDEFLRLAWAANLLQLGYPESASPYLRDLDESFITQDLTNPRYIHKWEIETLVNELLVVPKRREPKGTLYKRLDCHSLQAFVASINALKNLEDDESKLRISSSNILKEMQRIASRQFDWQRGWLNISQFYRYTFIYGTGAAAQFFQDSYGLTVNQFSLVGVALYSQFCEKPFVQSNLSVADMDLSSEVVAKALTLLSAPISRARVLGKQNRRASWPVSYQPSILRRFPCIAFGKNGEVLMSPLPQLILERVTSGIFYDVAAAGWDVREEYGRRFEDYAYRFLQITIAELSWKREYTYRWRKSEFRSSDVLWLIDSKVRLAVECKATRMSVDARYEDDPLETRGYEDLIKAVVQLWRYFSHCRLGYTDHGVHENACGLVLTIDSWLLMANKLVAELISKATDLAAEKYTEIKMEDRRPIIFCAINDLEATLSTATAQSFEAAIDRAVEQKRDGWYLSSSYDEVRDQSIGVCNYPFRNEMAQVLPWLGWIEKERQAASRLETKG